MKKSRNSLIAGIIGWTSAVVMFFPIFWMVLTSFKSEIDAVVPSILFEPTLQSYVDVNSRANYFHYALNSLVESVGSTVLALIIGLPAAYACAFYPGKRTKDLLLWMLSTKMMPAVGVLVPMYLLFRDAGLLDTRIGLVILFTLSNLPIVIWMLYSFFKDVPTPILEAGRMDGARFWTQMRYILIPISLPGIASTALLSIILCWNEAFWSLNLSASQSGPLTAFIASFSSPEGLFWAKLSAASTLAVAPILIMGWITQRQLVRGLTFGAVK
ncbi:sorbitol/mannitol transport system permease protein [Pararhizobium capsulatum DSM 1112]|uniref:Sorbitol/mannitol transport system permease protein n=1 Tax=Pararhizobium capsulatum DSM 1112 TaxID=1121113 RepID=A0ABU0C1P9_9HYPH|nr:carbohydrate ABC transporter permease [Pararhizobium capsulatum]MDQ0324113.1 sorbitol/mannitol transport system permease protein [Pararhizobium capsulatum DSM 1112]